MSFNEFGLSDKESAPHREALNKHDMGRKKYLSKIDRGSRETDQKNLPFIFSKPKKESAKVVTCWCTECGTYSKVTKSTYMVICRNCKEAYFISDDNSER